LLTNWVPEPGTREQILTTNPAKLYDLR
jgi:hypothetical protein